METRRTYDNTLRRERATETRNRIISAGAELLHATSIRDWEGLTVSAVAAHAGVSDRTVFRHFGNERGLRDAVMGQLEEDAGVELADLRLGDLPQFAARVLEYVSSYPMASVPPLDPTLSAAQDRRRQALLWAVTGSAEDWSQQDCQVAAAILDLLSGVPSYERLLVDWGLDRDEAIRGVTWVMELVGEAVREGRPPH